MNNLVDMYISWLKNNRIIAVIVVIGVVIIGIGSVTDSLGTIFSYFRAEQEAPENEKAWVDIQFEMINNSSEKIKISNLVEYYVTESDGPIIHEYPRGRVILNRFPTNIELQNTIKAGKSGYFTFEFPKSKTYQDLLLRGSGNVHFFIIEEGKKDPRVVSLPFHRHYFDDKISIKVYLNEKT